MDTNTQPESREKVEAWVSYWRGPTNPDENNWQFEQTRAAFYAGYDAARAPSPAVPSEAVGPDDELIARLASHKVGCDCDYCLGIDTGYRAASRPTWVRVEDGLAREACCHESLESRIGDFVSDCGMPADMDELIGMFQQFCREEGFDEYKTS